MRPRLIVFGLVMSLFAAQAFANQEGQGVGSGVPKAKVFGNSDVVELLKAGMDDSVVIAKIKQAPEADFKVESDDLIALKKAGASPGVISAMLARKTPTSDTEPKAGPSFGGYGPNKTGLLCW
jgi:hypothetical protein